MAKLSSFKQDYRAIQEGDWIRVGDEYLDLEIRTRGFTDTYFDAQATRQRYAAKSLGGDVAKLQNAIRRRINRDCLIEFVLLDVRNLQDDDGQDIPFDRFCDLLRDNDYGELLTACFKAAGQVGQQRSADLEDAVGNSPTSSTGGSVGAKTPETGSQT
jgi:hypothetical protein